MFLIRGTSMEICHGCDDNRWAGYLVESLNGQNLSAREF